MAWTKEDLFALNLLINYYIIMDKIQNSSSCVPAPQQTSSVLPPINLRYSHRESARESQWATGEGANARYNKIAPMTC